MKINLSQIPHWYIIGASGVMLYMRNRKFDTLVNDYSPAKIEYELDDIPASYEYFLKHFRNTIKSN
jgi:hypothetical protein